jgi:hypothetical protein
MSGVPSLSSRSARALAAACFLAVLSDPGISRADEPLAPEADTNPSVLPSSTARTNLVLAGAGVTVAWYGVAVANSFLFQDADKASSLRIPFAGPFIALAHTGCGEAENPCNALSVATRTALSIMSAVGQIGGVAIMMEGLFLKTASPSQEPAPAKLRRAGTGAPSALSFSVDPAPPIPGVRDTTLSGLSVSVSGRF